MTTVISGRHSDDEHRTQVLVETEGRQVRFDVVEIPDGTYGYSRAERELAEAGGPSVRVGLWAQPASYRWLVEVFAGAGVGDAQVSRVLAAVRAGAGTKEFRFVY
ncbi:hypothetical protein ACIRN4_11335 [Pimelobacter simplex]|uniref:Uncharacterized protein n=1 Tax=Nocardioides simplex TaxID=2045 RepID=A0A7J5DW21_NOCSI|nr:hypothetical protein [Pimelobacter simplex]KAB2809524.1 hypothetical protein F9L07_21160 [Pimelobacter simplex]